MAFESRSNVVDVYVRYLREKIDRPFGATSIETVRGVGYRLREGRRMSRLPIRVRLTLPFALAMALVLAAMGAVHLPPRRRRAAGLGRPEPARPGRGGDVARRRAGRQLARPRRQRTARRSRRSRAAGRDNRDSSPADAAAAARRGDAARASSRADASDDRTSAACAGDWRLLAPSRCRSTTRHAALVVGRSLAPRERDARIGSRASSCSPRRPRCCSRSSPATRSPPRRSGRSRRCGAARRRSARRRRAPAAGAAARATRSRRSP